MPALSELKVVAGHMGLEREIKVVSLMDAPDSYKWLKGGELILTSAFLFGGDEELLGNFVKNLINANVGCLGIKKGRFLSKIPESMIQIADEHRFPIFEIPYHFVWSDVISVFYELLHSSSEKNLASISPENIEQVYNAGRQGTRQLMDKLTEIYRVPLAVVRSNKKIQMDNGLPGVKLIGKTLADSPLFPENMGAATLEADKYFLTVCPIPFFRQGQADYMAIMSKSRSFLGKIRKLFHLLASLGKQENAADTGRAQVYRKFILDVMSGKLTEENIREIEHFRSGATLYTCVMLINSSEAMSVYKQVDDILKSGRLAKTSKTSNYIVDNAEKQEVVVMLELSFSETGESPQTWQQSLLEELEYSIMEMHGGCIGIGRLSLKLEDVLSSYYEARDACEIGQVLWENKRCFLYSMVSLYSALRRANQSQVDLSYIRHLDNNQAGLAFDGIATLEAYIECGSYKKAASELYIHENTLRYRIQKISDYLNMNAEDPIVANSLIMQIKLWKLVK